MTVRIRGVLRATRYVMLIRNRASNVAELTAFQRPCFGMNEDRVQRILSWCFKRPLGMHVICAIFRANFRVNIVSSVQKCRRWLVTHDNIVKFVVRQLFSVPAVDVVVWHRFLEKQNAGKLYFWLHERFSRRFHMSTTWKVLVCVFEIKHVDTRNDGIIHTYIR